MVEMVGKYYLLNGYAREVQRDIAIEKSSIYEVMRVLDGKPLFLKDHLIRFKVSLDMAGYKNDIDFNVVKSWIFDLIKINDICQVNVKMVFTPRDKGFDLMMYLVKTAVPTKEALESGVVVRTHKGKRKDPNVKSTAESYKDFLKKKEFEGVYELLFVDEKNEILEGSRSNVFFVERGRIYTAPAGSVLPGITRKQIFKICMEESIEVTEKYISLSELEKVEAIFLTGTSIGVLKVAKVDDMTFDVDNPIVVMLSEKYEDKMIGDIKRAEWDNEDLSDI
jgi:branched-chain amino acid aminotransferase